MAQFSSQTPLQLSVVKGDLLAQKQVEAWVNPWNRNFVPRLLLLPHGVSAALKKLTGPAPWKELSRRGLLATGEAVVTGGGLLPQKLIHVAGLTWYWSATEYSIQEAARNALRLAWEQGYRSVAFPLIGAGVGGFSEERVLKLMRQALEETSQDLTSSRTDPLEVVVVVWGGAKGPAGK